jgi:membrane-associated phospholipid phosphatase
MSVRTTCERLWCWYVGIVVAIAALTPGGGMVGHRPLLFVVVHLAVLIAALASAHLAHRRGEAAARWPRAVLALVGLPTVFSALCWVLPAVHPEPFEYAFAALDRRLFGTDLGRFAGHLGAAGTEVLQLCYASFYLLCMAAAVGALRGSGGAGFDRAVRQLTFGFLVSYLGYLLVPTLAPKVVLAFPDAIDGALLTPTLRDWIDGGEANPWDCFPSGHTMLTLTALALLWRENRRWFWWCLVPALGLIASTVLLRYHWGIDVVAGALLVWPTMWCCDWLSTADGSSSTAAPRH